MAQITQTLRNKLITLDDGTHDRIVKFINDSAELKNAQYKVDRRFKNIEKKMTRIIDHVTIAIGAEAAEKLLKRACSSCCGASYVPIETHEKKKSPVMRHEHKQRGVTRSKPT